MLPEYYNKLWTLEELVFIKNVNTRFGMPQTSGLALIYASEESTSIEPDYIKTRHKVPEESTGGN